AHGRDLHYWPDPNRLLTGILRIPASANAIVNDACRSVPRGRLCWGGRCSSSRGVSAVDTVMSWLVVPRVVSAIVIAVINRRGWALDKTCPRPHSAADCGAEGRTVTAGSGSPDSSPAACA